MPTDTLGAAGRSRSADPIGRARHPAECRPGHEEKRRRIRREIVPGKVASDRFDRTRKRGKRTPPKKAYPRLQRNPYRDDPARRPGTNASRIAPTISGSRLTVPERISPARRPAASPPKTSGKEPSGSLSPEKLRTTGRMSSRLFLRAAGADSGNDFPARSLLVTGS